MTQRVLTGHGPLTIQTQRGIVTLPITTDSQRVTVLQSVGPFIPAVIDSVMTGQAAAAAGLRGGDSVVAIDGQPIRAWTDLTTRVNASIGKPLKFDVIGAGGPRSLVITPKATADKTAAGKDTVLGKIGAATREITTHESIGVGRALAVGTRESWNMATTVAHFLRSLVVGEVSLKQLGGPIAITRASVTAARSGIEELFYLIALLSVNVAVLNLLPIPILDGGQILINVIESAKGSPFSMRSREYILRFGLVFIALLFIVVMFNDTRGGFARLFGWIFK
jgi:regulator of sigma E protease